ncbi:hypothetical protein CROQUDRAFT_660684 [Cronartium quercuum f. sp. fusiforme G11]|uniref:Endonuclease/exonuclease/phosphatase domain-containing protein n=1 Tax=Cronartium quercuum f. sp. fusiforme G11 TaxID=708437 RepID=A0A9P6NH24_9BASI|nr:hypothetical protein CROQUDRAFT_660684 [Cronartium quercuum f. sp. fusiforme G11]
MSTTTTRMTNEPIQSTSNYKKRNLIQLCTDHQRQSWIENDNLIPIKILTWNILAQCLVKRNLFPGSDCLKWKERGKVITEEIMNYDADVICLQEVDRIIDHGPILKKSGYDYKYVIGGYEDIGKQHGLLIGWKENKIEKIDEQIIKFDEEIYNNKIGLSRVTKNISLICCLKLKTETTKHLVIGTCHLFWHPRFSYERCRQISFLSNLIQNFKQKQLLRTDHLITILAGDLNEEPNGPGYKLITGKSFNQEQIKIFDESKVIHKSVDKEQSKEIYETIEGDEDRVFKDVRKPKISDELFDLIELQKICGNSDWISLYGTFGIKMESENGNRFIDREEQKSKIREGKGEEDEIESGDWEPMWTNFTPLWRCTLDYIFILNDNNYHQIKVTKLLPTHRTLSLIPGLPRQRIEPSDHIALMTEILF